MAEPGRVGGSRLWRSVLALTVVGCAGPAYGEAWSRSFDAATRSSAAGRYEEAARHYEQAARNAVRPKDRDEARFMQARMMQRLGRDREARDLQERLLAESPEGPRSARARFELARASIAAGDESGWDRLAEAIARHSDHGSARGAILDWVEHLRASGGEPAVRAGVDRLLPKVSDPATAQHLEYVHALSLERSGSLAEAHDRLLLVARRHPLPEGNLTDDAYWRASLVAEKLGQHERAIADLRELLQFREVSWFGQSYERPKYPLAQMRIAELHRDRLGDWRAAREEFRRMAQAHASSTLSDDALWQEAIASRRLGEAEEACGAIERLRDRHPGTRYLGCVKELCPSATLPPGTRDCPPYLRAQLEPGAELPRTTAPDPEARDRE